MYLASDKVIPDQAAYVVPALQITIVPLIDSEHISWNLARLASDGFGVPVHLHKRGSEIHLGFSPVHGRTFLGPGLRQSPATDRNQKLQK